MSAAAAIDDVAQAVALIRDARRPVRVFVAATGAGARLQGDLWDAPGASAFLAGGVFTYAARETDDFLGYRPGSYCAMDTALDMAMTAYVRARESLLGDVDDRMPVGLGLTATVATSREHRGDHRVFAAVLTPEACYGAYVQIPKAVGYGARLADGAFADRFGLAMLMAAMGLPKLALDHPLVNSMADIIGNVAAVPHLGVDAMVVTPNEIDDEQLRSLFFRHPVFTPRGTRVEMPQTADCVFLPGMFDPIHDGHRGIAAAVERISGKRVVYNTTADSVHKPPLRVTKLLDRVAMFRAEKWQPRAETAKPRVVLFTKGDPLFIDKARRFPNCGFVVGADTLLRMLDPKWGPETGPLLEAFRALGTRFYVIGRLVDGAFTTLADARARIPGNYDDLFHDVPGRWDMSSSEIRARRRAEDKDKAAP